MNDLVERMRAHVPTSWYRNSTIILEAADEIERLEKEHDEMGNACSRWLNEAIISQAREAKLREALMKVEGCDSWKESTEMAYEALAMPHDDTALKEYRKQVLLEAAEFFGDSEVTAILRGMVEE